MKENNITGSKLVHFSLEQMSRKPQSRFHKTNTTKTKALPLSISMPVAEITNQSRMLFSTEPGCDLRIFPNTIVPQTDTDKRQKLA